MSHIEIDGEVFWRQNDEIGKEGWVEKEETVLASDSKNRLDSKYIKQKNFEQAQK